MSPLSKLRWLVRFRLRSLLVATGVCATVAAWLAHHHQVFQAEQAAIARLTNATSIRSGTYLASQGQFHFKRSLNGWNDRRIQALL